MADDLIVTTFAADADGTGRLSVTASANGFCGVGAAWFDTLTLREFARSLSEYPLPDSGVSIASGFGASSQDLEQEHVRIAVYPIGVLGQVGVGVHLATERWPDTRSSGVHDVRLELQTTYQRLGEFSGDLLALLDGSLGEARLGGERLA